MLDDFLVRAAVAGSMIAIVAGPVGCVIVWRRLAYFGDTMAHSALLGVALGVLAGVSAMIGVFVVAVAIALSLLAFQRRRMLANDAVLGILSHGALATGLVLIAVITWTRLDLLALLIGDILSVSGTDIAVIAVSIDRGGQKKVVPFLKRLGLEHLPIYLDPKSKLARAFGIAGLPMTFLIDAEGRVVRSLSGPAEWDSAAALAFIRRYLAQGGKSGLQDAAARD